MKRLLDLKKYFELNRGKTINIANKYWLDIYDGNGKDMGNFSKRYHKDGVPEYIQIVFNERTVDVYPCRKDTLNPEIINVHYKYFDINSDIDALNIVMPTELIELIKQLK